MHGILRVIDPEDEKGIVKHNAFLLYSESLCVPLQVVLPRHYASIRLFIHLPRHQHSSVTPYASCIPLLFFLVSLLIAVCTLTIFTFKSP